MMRWLIIFILIPLNLAVSQAIQEYSVYDFGGGLVTSFKNSRLQDNMATVLVDFDIDDGVLVRRQGMELWYTDDFSGQPISSLLPWYGPGVRKLLTLRQMGNDDSTSGYWRASILDDLDTNGLLLTVCDDAGEHCTTLVANSFYSPRRLSSYPYGINRATYNERLVFGATKSEPGQYNGSGFFPLRPMGPGQPITLALDGDGGNLNGGYYYRYSWLDDGPGTNPHDSSNYSPPSWLTWVSNGRVYLRFGPKTSASNQDDLLLWRKHVDSSNYKLVTRIELSAEDTNSVYTYIDNIAEGSLGKTSVLDYAWSEYCGNTDIGQDQAVAPEGMTVSFVQVADDDARRILKGLDTATTGDSILSVDTIDVAYTLYYIDSLGRHSYAASTTCFVYCNTVACDTSFYAEVTDIPVPAGSGVQSKLLYRKFAYGSYTNSGPPNGYWQNRLNAWRLIATLATTATAYSDNLTGVGSYEDSPNLPDSIGSIDMALTIPVDDSLISFQPTYVDLHGTRLYAIGDPQDKNRVYFSDFGRMSTFAPDKFLPFPSEDGDWFNGLVSTSNNELLLFRQNSIHGLSGLTFYQYSADKVGVQVGLTAPKSLKRGRTGIFFAHSSGIYNFGEPVPISFPIEKSIDSVESFIPRSSGATIDDEYWWSVPVSGVVPSKTYIYSPIPAPHWKSYSFGFSDMVGWDWGTTATDYETDRWIIAKDNDSLYRWGDCDTCTTDGGQVFISQYQSKAFLDNGMNREKIFYLDIDGSGTLDSLHVLVLDKLGTDTLFNDIVAVDFSDNKKDRVMINKIVKDCTVRLEDRGSGDYRIEGYVIGWVPWDGGRMK